MPGQPSLVRRRRLIFLTCAALLVGVATAAGIGAFYGPRWLTRAVRLRTGFDVTAKHLSLNPFTGRLAADGLTVRNPPTFPAADFLEVRHLDGTLRIRSVFAGQLIFEVLAIDVSNVTLVRRKDGVTNVQALRRNLLEFGGRRSGEREGSDRPTLIVRQLRLQVSQLQLADYSRREPTVRTEQLDIDQAYLDVQEVSDLLEPATLARLAPVALKVSAYLPAEFAATFRAAAAEAGVPEAKAIAPVDFKPTFDALEESRKP